MELLREFPRLFLVLQEANMEEHIFWGRWIDRQPAEPINMGLGLPGRCLTVKSYSSSAADQRWRSADPVLIVFSHCRA